MFKKLIKKFIISHDLDRLKNEIEENRILTAKMLINQLKLQGILDNIKDAEFKVFSQYGDDGIIQYLINNVEIENHQFIEFGVQNYTESNTRFLLINNNWSGLVIDGSKEHITYIKQDNIYWRYDITAIHSFVDQENINKIFKENNFEGEIGLLSIDIDGNDYWIWEKIEVVNPIIVIAEYNSIFGNEYAVTIPYNTLFIRDRSHYSHLYWGCSLKALCLLAEKKGYYFVGSNSNGNNAFFVRKDKIGKIKQVTVESGYVKSKFRESRNEKGQLSFVGGDERIKIIQDMVVYDLERCQLVKIKDLQ